MINGVGGGVGRTTPRSRQEQRLRRSSKTEARLKNRCSVRLGHRTWERRHGQREGKTVRAKAGEMITDDKGPHKSPEEAEALSPEQERVTDGF